MILIVTEPRDFHVDPIIRLLRELGHEPLRLHKEDIPLKSQLTLKYSNAGVEHSISTPKGRYDLQEITAVWWRRPTPFRLPESLPPERKRFATLETEHAFTGLFSSPHIYWMSRPELIRRASNKPAQIRRAIEFGFKVPRTLITNRPEDAMRFFHECNGRLVYKVLSDATLGQRDRIQSDPSSVAIDELRSVYTAVVDEEILHARRAQIETTPCLFQEHIQKSTELRITVIGDEVFSAEIHSQEHTETKLDWRHYEVPVRWSQATVPTGLKRLCLSYVASWGLNFSAMDFILTPDGEYVFLESNPNGQWQFVEHLVPSLAMKNKLLDCLLKQTVTPLLSESSQPMKASRHG